MLLTGEDGQSLPPRRDPYARHTDFDSAWCFVDDAAAFDWRHPWEPLPFDEYLIYEVQPHPLEYFVAFARLLWEDICVTLFCTQLVACLQ